MAAAPPLDALISIDRQRRALDVARSFGDDTSAHPSLLLIVGYRGAGKTRLVHEIAGRVRAGGTRRRISLIAADDVVRCILEAIRANALDIVGRRYGDADLVAIEDIDTLRGKPATLEELARVIGQWVEAGARILCTAGCLPNEVAEFEQRLPPAPTSRMVMLGRPSRRDMRAIIRGLATHAGITIDARSVADVAAWCDGDIRRALGAIQQMEFEAAYRNRRT